jgi:hypothetical protein
LKADLERCQSLLETPEGFEQRFPLGQLDTARIFRVSQKLYGREIELKILEESFQRVVSGSSSFEVVIVKGFSERPP